MSANKSTTSSKIRSTGLELLTVSKTLFVRQYGSHQPMPFDVENIGGHLNRYDIIDTSLRRILFAWEIEVVNVNKSQSLNVRIVDCEGRPVMEIVRNYSCLTCCLKWFNCFGTAGYNLTVNLQNGNKVGSITQIYNGWTPKFKLENAFGKHIFTIMGPPGGDCCYSCNMLMDASFPILLPTGEKVGVITRDWTALMAFDSGKRRRNVDTFGISFPPLTVVEEKALLLAAVFAIDFMFFNHEAKDDTAVAIENERRRKSRRKSAIESEDEALFQKYHPEHPTEEDDENEKDDDFLFAGSQK